MIFLHPVKYFLNVEMCDRETVLLISVTTLCWQSVRLSVTDRVSHGGAGCSYSVISSLPSHPSLSPSSSSTRRWISFPLLPHQQTLSDQEQIRPSSPPTSETPE